VEANDLADVDLAGSISRESLVARNTGGFTNPGTRVRALSSLDAVVLSGVGSEVMEVVECERSISNWVLAERRNCPVLCKL